MRTPVSGDDGWGNGFRLLVALVLSWLRLAYGKEDIFSWLLFRSFDWCRTHRKKGVLLIGCLETITFSHKACEFKSSGQRDGSNYLPDKRSTAFCVQKLVDRGILSFLPQGTGIQWDWVSQAYSVKPCPLSLGGQDWDAGTPWHISKLVSKGAKVLQS